MQLMCTGHPLIITPTERPLVQLWVNYDLPKLIICLRTGALTLTLEPWCTFNTLCIVYVCLHPRCSYLPETTCEYDDSLYSPRDDSSLSSRRPCALSVRQYFLTIQPDTNLGLVLMAINGTKKSQGIGTKPKIKAVTLNHKSGQYMWYKIKVWLSMESRQWSEISMG